MRPPVPAWLVLATLAACAAPLQVRTREPVALHPLAVVPEAPARGVAGDLPGPAKDAADADEADDEDDDDRAGSAGTATAAGGAGSAGSAPARGRVSLSATAAAPSLVPAGGRARSDLVASAARLLGIRGSFQDRSFLGHVLRINDLLPPGAVSASYGPALALQSARAAGLLRAGDGARPGDLAFFRCPGACGDAARGEPAGGIVESAEGGATRLVCYVDGEVRRCLSGDGTGKDGLAVGDLVGVADPWSLATAAAGAGVSPAAKPRP